MRYCVVKNCESWKQNKNINSIKFFRFPKDANRRRIWIKACGKPFVNHKTGTICSLHFTDDDWRLKDNLLNIPIAKRQLNENAVPTINIFSNASSIERTVRLKKRQSKKIVNNILNDSNKREYKQMETPNEEVCRENISNFRSVEVQTEVEIECARELKIEELEKELKAIKKENKLLKKENEQLSNLENEVSKIFTKGQVDRLKNPKKEMKWALEDISAATCLYSTGSRAYRFLYAKNYPLPATSTLRRWAKKPDIRPGLNLIEDYSMSETDNFTVLAFDEMEQAI